jgi:hypothetical protein
VVMCRVICNPKNANIMCQYIQNSDNVHCQKIMGEESQKSTPLTNDDGY